MNQKVSDSDDRFFQWYEKLADRKTRRRPAFLSFLLPEARANEYTVWACERTFAERGYRLENREDVKGSISVGGIAAPTRLMRLCFSRADTTDAPDRTESVDLHIGSLERYDKRCQRIANRRTKRRPPEVRFKVRTSRGETVRKAIERKVDLATKAFEQRGYRLQDRVVSGSGSWNLNPVGVGSERPVIILTFARAEEHDAE